MFMATQQDIERTKRIITEIVNRKLALDEVQLQSITEKLLNLAYSLGCSYSEASITELAKLHVENWLNI